MAKTLQILLLVSVHLFVCLFVWSVRLCLRWEFYTNSNTTTALHTGRHKDVWIICGHVRMHPIGCSDIGWNRPRLRLHDVAFQHVDFGQPPLALFLHLMRSQATAWTVHVIVQCSR